MATIIANQDEQLRLTGSTGNPYETVTTTANGTGAYYGSDRTVQQHLVVGGTVSGTTPTLTVKFQDSADGTTYTDMGIAFPAASTTQSTATGSLGAFPTVALKTQPGRPYVRVVKTVGGTSASFGMVAVLHSPPQGF